MDRSLIGQGKSTIILSIHSLRVQNGGQFELSFCMKCALQMKNINLISKNLLKFQFRALIFLLISVKFPDKENICYEIDVIDRPLCRVEARTSSKIVEREKSLRLLSDCARHQQLHFIIRPLSKF